MKIILKKLVPYLIIYFVLFFVIPLIFKLIISKDVFKDVIIILLFLINPAVCLVLGTAYGSIHGFKPYFLLVAPLLFILSLWILYNSSALIYNLLYIAVSLAGMTIGSILHYIGEKKYK